mmetsp:Transcript_58636/g.141463  ORF Transcript_58636/g.141463 Transcript_58636/m.141463 type:complete len:301 (+) Transcript_58636:964-1866(+)
MEAGLRSSSMSARSRYPPFFWREETQPHPTCLCTCTPPKAGGTSTRRSRCILGRRWTCGLRSRRTRANRIHSPTAPTTLERSTLSCARRSASQSGRRYCAATRRLMCWQASQPTGYKMTPCLIAALGRRLLSSSASRRWTMMFTGARYACTPRTCRHHEAIGSGGTRPLRVRSALRSRGWSRIWGSPGSTAPPSAANKSMRQSTQHPAPVSVRVQQSTSLQISHTTTLKSSRTFLVLSLVLPLPAHASPTSFLTSRKTSQSCTLRTTLLRLKHCRLLALRLSLDSLAQSAETSACGLVSL